MNAVYKRLKQENIYIYKLIFKKNMKIRFKDKIKNIKINLIEDDIITA